MGDWRISTNPDYVDKNGQRTTVPEKITRGIGSFLVHPNYTAKKDDPADGATQRNDIALIRLDDSVPLYQGYRVTMFEIMVIGN